MYKLCAIEISAEEKVSIEELLDFCRNRKKKLFFLPEGNELNAEEEFFLKKTKRRDPVYQPVLNKLGLITKVLSHRTSGYQKHSWAPVVVSDKSTFSKSYIIALSS